MSMLNIFNVAGSAVSAQSQRLNVVASNLANADTVAGPVPLEPVALPQSPHLERRALDVLPSDLASNRHPQILAGQLGGREAVDGDSPHPSGAVTREHA